MYYNCSGYKLTHSLVTFLILIVNNWNLFNEEKLYISGLNCLDICNHPSWLGDSKKFELNEKFCFFPLDEIEKFEFFDSKILANSEKIGRQNEFISNSLHFRIPGTGDSSTAPPP